MFLTCILLSCVKSVSAFFQHTYKKNISRIVSYFTMLCGATNVDYDYKNWEMFFFHQTIISSHINKQTSNREVGLVVMYSFLYFSAWERKRLVSCECFTGVVSCAKRGDPSGRNIGRSEHTWRALHRCASGSVLSTRQILQIATRNLPTCTCTASHLKQINIQIIFPVYMLHLSSIAAQLSEMVTLNNDSK